MKKQEYDKEWVDKKTALVQMRSKFSSFDIRFRWVDTSGTDCQGYSGYIVAEKNTGKKDEYQYEIYEEIGRLVSSSLYLEDGVNLVGDKGCITRCSFKKQDVKNLINKLN